MLDWTRGLSAPLLLGLAGVVAATGAGVPIAAAAGERASRAQTTHSADAGHSLLARQVGIWDARVERRKKESGRIERSRAVETNRLCCGGLFLVTEFEGKVDRRPHQGHGILGYDPARKKYTLTWIDSLQSSFTHGEGDYDAALDTLTLRLEHPDGTGGVVRHRAILTWKGRDARRLTVYAAGPDGEEIVDRMIKYRRRR